MFLITIFRSVHRLYISLIPANFEKIMNIMKRHSCTVCMTPDEPNYKF